MLNQTERQTKHGEESIHVPPEGPRKSEANKQTVVAPSIPGPEFYPVQGVGLLCADHLANQTRPRPAINPAARATLAFCTHLGEPLRASRTLCLAHRVPGAASTESRELSAPLGWGRAALVQTFKSVPGQACSGQFHEPALGSFLPFLFLPEEKKVLPLCL